MSELTQRIWQLSLDCDECSTSDTRHALQDLAIDVGNEMEAQQAKIDSLMLEYCPDEMTQEQIDSWKKHQVVAEHSHLKNHAKILFTWKMRGRKANE